MSIEKKQNPQIDFQTQTGYEVYEGISDDCPEWTTDRQDAIDIFNMSYCADVFIVEVVKTRTVIKV